MKKIDGEIYLVVENTFGSFFDAACVGMDTTPQYSSDTIQSIQDSETIGKTTLHFADSYDLTTSLLKSPNDKDIREEEGFGNVDMINKIASLLNISKAHRISLDINKDEWLNNIDLFENLIDSGIVTTIKIKGTYNQIVRLGEGGDRAIREKVETSGSGRTAVEEAFTKFPK